MYVMYGFVPLGYKMIFTDDITPEMRTGSQKPYIIMGLLDSLGTFLTAMGAVYTPGVFQTLLNQTLVPFTLLTSALALGIRYSRGQIGGALFIIAGAVVTVAPAVADPTKAASAQFRWYGARSSQCSRFPSFLSPHDCDNDGSPRVFTRPSVISSTPLLSAFNTLTCTWCFRLSVFVFASVVHGWADNRYSALVFMSSNIPMAVSAVYKEWGFKTADTDVF